MKYRIVSDSSVNAFHISGGIDYRTVPLKILIDEKEFCDDETLHIETFVSEIEKSEKNSTSCPNAFEWKEAFEGADIVFVVTISSNLSGSYSSAMHAAQEYMEENPGRKVYVVDSRGTGGIMHLIVDKLAELMERGLSFEEIRNEIREYHSHTNLLFCLESLSNLAKNGRVNTAVAKVAGFLGIRFIGRASPEGRIQQVAVARGEKKTLTTLVSEIVKNGYEGGKVWISHCLNLKTAESLKQKLIEAFPSAAELIRIEPMQGLCTYYAEKGGLLIGFECATAVDRGL